MKNAHLTPNPAPSVAAQTTGGTAHARPSRDTHRLERDSLDPHRHRYPPTPVVETLLLWLAVAWASGEVAPW